jgi:DNA modification methylase
MDGSKVKASLSQVDWSFSGRQTYLDDEVKPFDARAYHWYPATYVPEIPFTLISVLTDVGNRVYDPFSGIGTTYFQALSTARNPVGGEICKVAVMFTRKLSSLFDPSCDRTKLIKEVKELSKSFDKSDEYINLIDRDVNLEELQKWYSQKDFNELCYMISQHERAKSDRIESILWIAISSSLKTYCCQDRGWGCIADNVTPNQDQLEYKGFLSGTFDKAITLIRAVENHTNGLGEFYERSFKKLDKKYNIYHRNAADDSSILDKKADLVITSPPYPEMTDYVASQRLTYYWLGEQVGLGDEFNNDMNEEIGARRKRSRSRSSCEYIEKMKAVNKNVLESIKKGGYICYVMPEIDAEDSRAQDIKTICDDMDRRSEIRHFKTLSRIIPANRRSHNIKWTTLSRENIFIYRKV